MYDKFIIFYIHKFDLCTICIHYNTISMHLCILCRDTTLENRLIWNYYYHYCTHYFGSIYSYKSYHKISTNRFIHNNCARSPSFIDTIRNLYEIMKWVKLSFQKCLRMYNTHTHTYRNNVSIYWGFFLGSLPFQFFFLRWTLH